MHVRFRKNKFDRWIVIHPQMADSAWSGSRWVRVDCDGFPASRIQVSNFETLEQAKEYAKGFGFVVDDAMVR